MNFSKIKIDLEPKLEEFFKRLFGIDLRALACFRIGMALLLLMDLAYRAQNLQAFYTDEGILPRSILYGKFPGHYYFSIHSLGGMAWFQTLLFLLHAFFALSLLVGYRTRAAVFFCWLLLVSLDARNPLVLQNGDIYFVLLFFWSLFLPLGARWSFDRLVAFPEEKVHSYWVSLGTVAILCQVLIIYFFSSLNKTSPEWNSEGTAVYLALSLGQYSNPWGQALLHFPGLLNGLTHGVLGLERFGGFFLFVPWRTGFFRAFTLGALALMHLGFIFFMVLGIFPWVCLCALVIFVPSPLWDWLEGRDLWKKLLWGSLRLRLEGSSQRIPRMAPSFGGELLAGLFLVYVFFYNFGGLHPEWDVPDLVKLPFRALFLEQRWTMFAPRPWIYDGWFIAAGTLADGNQVDLWKEGAPISWDRPLRLDQSCKDSRWQSYLFNLTLEPDSEGPEFSSYLIRQWNEKEPWSRQLKSLEIFFMRQKTVLPGQETQLERVSLGNFDGSQIKEPGKKFLFPQP